MVSKFCRDEIFECFMGFENSQKNSDTNWNNGTRGKRAQ